MTVPVADRQILTDGTVHLRSGDCTFTFRRLRPGAVVVTIDGYDHGQFGPATVDLSRTGDLLRICGDGREFERAVAMETLR